MPWRKLRGWYAYSLLEPFGDERADLRTAYAFAQIANIIGKPKRKPSWEVSDFMIDYDKIDRKTRTREVDADAQFKKLMLIARVNRWEIIDKRGKNNNGSET